MMSVPTELVPEIRALLARKHENPSKGISCPVIVKFRCWRPRSLSKRAWCDGRGGITGPTIRPGESDWRLDAHRSSFFS